MVPSSLFTGTKRVVFKATDRADRSSAGGVGTPVVVSTGPAVPGVGIGASVLSVLWVLSVVGSLVVVSTVVVVDSVVGESVWTLVTIKVVVSGVVVVSCVVVVLASVVVTVEASVLPPGLKKSSLHASRGASFGSWAQLSHT